MLFHSRDFHEVLVGGRRWVFLLLGTLVTALLYSPGGFGLVHHLPNVTVVT
jgi:hypothetical protein